MESKSDIHQKNITYLYWKSKEIPQKYQIIYFEHTKSFVSLIQNYVIFILKHVVTGKINNETTKFSGEIGDLSSPNNKIMPNLIETHLSSRDLIASDIWTGLSSETFTYNKAWRVIRKLQIWRWKYKDFNFVPNSQYIKW